VSRIDKTECKHTASNNHLKKHADDADLPDTVYYAMQYGSASCSNNSMLARGMLQQLEVALHHDAMSLGQWHCGV
jgi:hypothetical protein